MKLIIKPRQSGKTSELIRMSEETNAYILTLNRGMAEYVSKMAEQQGYNILFPITLDEYMRSRLKGSHVTHILIDNADMVLQHIFSEATIDAITMSEQEPTVQAVPIEVLQEIQNKTYRLHPINRGDNDYANGVYDGMCRVIDIVCNIIDSKIKELSE